MIERESCCAPHPSRSVGRSPGSGDARSLAVQRLLGLQRTAGNRAVQTLVRNGLRRPADQHEHEAHAFADTVLAGSTGRSQTDPMRRDRPVAGLPDSVRDEMAAGLGGQLPPVRVHRDQDAAALTARMGAKGVTVGQDVYLGAGAQDLQTLDSRRTLAHEIAHVNQQALPTGAGKRRAPGPRKPPMTPAARRPMAAPTVTAVNVPAAAEVGAGGRAIEVNAVAAGNQPLVWTLVGAPAGVTITPRGRRGARILATAAAAAGAGGNFQAQAALAAAPGDNAVSGNILLVGVTPVTVTPQPAFAASIATAVGPIAPPANSIDPNRDGITGNTGLVNIVTAPAGRATTVRLTPARGVTVAAPTLTPGTETGPTAVRVEDTATGAFAQTNLTVNPVPTRVASMTNGGAGGAGTYGQINNILFTPTNGAPGALTRVVGETIGAAGRDDFNIVPTLNGTGPNPVPNLGQAAPGNNWPDNVLTGTADIDVNPFVGPGGRGLPAITDNRQGMHYLGWTGAPPWSGEFANGVQRVMLIQRGNAFFVRTEQRFGGVTAPPREQPYAATNPLIAFTNVTVTPNAPAARGLAADGVAQAALGFVSSTPARTVNLTLLSGSMAFTTGLAGVAVAGPHTMQAGLVAMTARVRIADSTFANRRADQDVRIVPVRVRSLTGPREVPAGTATATLNVIADPGGRTLVPTVDTPGFVAAQVAPATPADPGRQITVTRPGPGPATVRVTVADSVLAAQSASIRIRFR